jgi:hypothetical protein
VLRIYHPMLFLCLEFVLKNPLLFWYFCLYMWSVTFKIPSLFCTFSILIIICLGIFLFWSCLFGILKASCTWISFPFSRLRKFSAFMLWNTIPLVCISSSSSIPKIHRFGYLMMSQMSYMFHSYFLSNFSWSLTDLIFLLLSPTLCLQLAPVW